MDVVMSFSMQAAKTPHRKERSGPGQQKYFWHDPALINQEAPAPNTCHILAIIELSITLGIPSEDRVISSQRWEKHIWCTSYSDWKHHSWDLLVSNPDPMGIVCIFVISML